jgi:hypothetical protein
MTLVVHDSNPTWDVLRFHALSELELSFLCQEMLQYSRQSLSQHWSNSSYQQTHCIPCPRGDSQKQGTAEVWTCTTRWHHQDPNACVLCVSTDNEGLVGEQAIKEREKKRAGVVRRFAPTKSQYMRLPPPPPPFSPIFIFVNIFVVKLHVKVKMSLLTPWGHMTGWRYNTT